jgi:excisionase family DNA binding protein
MTDRLAAAVTELIEALREELRMEAEAGPRAPDRLLSVDEVAATLGLGRSVIYGEIAAGRLRSFRVGRRRLISASAIAEYIASRERVA